MTEQMKEAVLWKKGENGIVHCYLCNFHCRIAPGKVGGCRVRKNIDGVLYSLNYYALCSAAADPIEKKPLFHFQPASRSFSLACPGCNFQCDFCQNWQISQSPRMQGTFRQEDFTPETLVQAALRSHCRSISYTYTEPTIFMELCSDVGRIARAKGLKNVFVSNGYMTTEAIDYARDFLGAINVDLKAFTEEFYRDVCKAKLAPVLDTLRYIAKQTDIWLEITTLIVPGLNDSDEELQNIAKFIADELGPHIPWHVSRFHSDFQRDSVDATPAATLRRAHEIGRRAGLLYVYVGNLPGSEYENTLCHKCSHLLIERQGYRITQFNLLNSACPSCSTPLHGIDLQPVQT